MKKIIFLFAAVAAFLSTASCSIFYEESVDTIVSFEFVDENDETIGLGLELLLSSTQELIETFGNEFMNAGAEQYSSSNRRFILRAQNGEKRASKNISNIADKAAKKMASDFTCPVDGIFAMQMNYGGSGQAVTVWKHDYRPKL